MLCSKCNEPVTAFVTCLGALCSGSYHYHCAGVAETTYSKMDSKERSAWRCVTCRGVSPLKLLQSKTEFIKEVEEFRHDFVSMRDDVVTIAEDLPTALQNIISDLNAQPRDVVPRLDAMDERLLTVERKVTALTMVQKQLTDTQLRFEILKVDNNNQDQFPKLNNIEIQGISNNSKNLHSIFNDTRTKVSVILLHTQYCSSGSTIS